MDFMDRGIRQPQQVNNNGGVAPQAQNQSNHSGKKPGRFSKMKNHKMLNVTYVALLFSVTVLIVGVVSSIFLFDGTRDKESRLVDKSKYQAVFLNGGQVYFGKVADLNNKYLSLTNIYYLTPTQAVQSGNNNTTQNNNFTIKRLGCELHRPQDVMVINREQIIFWENLKEDSNENTVPGAIKKLSEQKQDCEQNQSNSSNNTNNANGNASNSNNAASNNTNNNNAATNTPSTPASTEPAAGTDTNTGN